MPIALSYGMQDALMTESHLSPTGDRTVFCRGANYTAGTPSPLNQLWVREAGKRDRVLTKGKGSRKGPKWANRQPWIVFLSNESSADQSLPYLYDFGKNRVVKLFRKIPEGISFESVQWLPDTHAAKIQAPILLIHGALDSMVPVGQAQMFARALADLKKPHELFILNESPHGPRSRRDIRAVVDKAEQWMCTHLLAK